MTVFVMRGGRLIEKASLEAAREDRRSIFPTPMISRMEPFESPVTGKEIGSWRERDADMKAAGAIDPRDLPAPTKGRNRKEETHARPDSGFKWGDPGG